MWLVHVTWSLLVVQISGIGCLNYNREIPNKLDNVNFYTNPLAGYLWALCVAFARRDFDFENAIEVKLPTVVAFLLKSYTWHVLYKKLLRKEDRQACHKKASVLALLKVSLPVMGIYTVRSAPSCVVSDLSHHKKGIRPC
jgi:hypothetical protein